MFLDALELDVEELYREILAGYERSNLEKERLLLAKA